MRIKSFAAWRPAAGQGLTVSSVPYDTVDTEEARVLATGNEASFLHVIRPEIDFPAGQDAYADAVYTRGVENLARLRAAGHLVREDASSFYVYRLTVGAHVQRGVVACCHVDDYVAGRIRKHEKTREKKERDRTRHVRALRAHTGPVFLTYRDVPDIDLLVAGIEQGPPLYAFTAEDGVEHAVWSVPDREGGLAAAFEAVPLVYIADGHHRTAAAARAGLEWRAENAGHTGMEEYNWFLAILFPAAQLRVLPYNRAVRDLNGLTESAFLDAVRARFEVEPDTGSVPPGPRSAQMYLAGRWYGLRWDAERTGSMADPVSGLDVSTLQEQLLAPVLGIDDPRTDERITFIGGARGTSELARLVDSGDRAVAFSMHPVGVDQVMDIADAGLIMPPKSTWFEPKPRSGLLVHEV